MAKLLGSRLAALIATLLLVQPNFSTCRVPDYELFPYLEPAASIPIHFSDNESSQLRVNDGFMFLGNRYHNLFINQNGIITLGDGSKEFRYRCQLNQTLPTISVYMTYSFGNAHNTGTVFYCLKTTNRSLAKASADVFRAFPELATSIKLNWMLVVTWHEIPAERHTSQRNTFQAILTSNGFESFVIFYYNKITWPSKHGIAVPAEAGIFNRVPDSNTYLIPGSCTLSLVNITGMSNIGVPGKFVFRVDAKLTHPSYVEVPCISPNSMVDGDTTEVCGLTGLCLGASRQFMKVRPSVVPILGNVQITLFVARGIERSSVKSVRCIFFSTLHPVALEETEGRIMKGDTNSSKVMCYVPVLENLKMVDVVLEFEFFSRQILRFKGHIWVKKSKDGFENRLSYGSDRKLHLASNYLEFLNASKQEVNYDLRCQQWYDEDVGHLSGMDILPCPRAIRQAEVDWRFIRETNAVPKASTIFVQAVPRPSSSSGSKCVYNEQGFLTFGAPAGSLIHRYSPNGWNTFWNHFTHDALPSLYCCKWSANVDTSCAYFYEKRALPLNQKYFPPKFAQIWNGNHIQTFDGKHHKINGVGDFWLIKYQNRNWNNDLEEFLCQGRIEHVGVQNFPVVNAVVLKTLINGNPVTIQVARNTGPGFRVHVDGDLLPLSELNTLYHDGVNVFLDKVVPSEIKIVFQSGIVFKITQSDDRGLNIIVAVGMHLINKMNGLLGNSDGLNGIFSGTMSLNLTVHPEDSLFLTSRRGKSLGTEVKIQNLGRKSSEALDRIIEASKTVIMECPPLDKVEGGQSIMNSLAVGSTFQLICDGDDDTTTLPKTHISFTCMVIGNSAKWVDANGRAILSDISCNNELEENEEETDAWVNFRPR